MKFLRWFLPLVSSAVLAQNVTINALPVAPSVTATDSIPLYQSGSCSATSGTCQTTPAALLTYVDANVAIAASQLVSGTLLAGRMPALTGDCTTTVGAVATTCTKTNGVAFGPAATVATITGTGSAVLATSPTLVTPALGTPTALNLSNATGLPAAALPALTGDVTTTAGTVATTVGKVNGAVIPTSAVVVGTNSSNQLAAATTTGTGSVVLATSPTLVTPALGTPSAINLTNATGLPAFGAHTSTTVVCASNTINTAGCDVQLTGTADQTLINTAIANCGNPNQAAFVGQITTTTLTITTLTSGTVAIGEVVLGSGVSANTHITAGSGTSWTITPSQTVSAGTSMTAYDPGASGNGCAIKLRNGVYNLSATVIIDRSQITLTGESVPEWGAAVGGWVPGGGNSVALIGTAGVKLVASSTGYPLITIAHTNLPDNGELRHRGVGIDHLYLVGNAYNANGIDNGASISNPDDAVYISYIKCQRLLVCLNVTMDGPTIDHLDAQDIAGNGITIGGYIPRISNSIMWDIGGSGIQDNAVGATIVNNTVGDTQQDGVRLAAQGGTFTGNSMGAANISTANITVLNSGWTVSNNVINNSFGSFSSKTRNSPAIYVNASNDVFIGNTFIPHGTEAAGVYAIGLGESGGTNNVAIGNNIISGWNNGSANTIQIATAPQLVSGNPGGNNGHSSYIGATPVVSSCGTTPSIDTRATDSSGTVTVGTVAAASCTVTFATPYTTWNHCRVTSQGIITSFAYSYTLSAITVTGTSLVGDLFDYQCDGG